MNQIPNIEETHNTREVEELAKKLRMVANMINMGEKIRWGQETTLMDDAADSLEALHHQLQKAREQAYKDGAKDVRDFAQVEIMKRASQLRDDITTFTSETIHSELDQDKK